MLVSKKQNIAKGIVLCHIDILLCHIDTGYCLGKPIVSQRDMFVSYRNVGKFSFVEGIWLVMSQRHWTVSHRYLSVSYGHLSVSSNIIKGGCLSVCLSVCYL